ncbi:MAG: hypothetical protein K5681_00850 [Treponema sp.]|nr:hypothetical protein [Treponema sp.]
MSIRIFKKALGLLIVDIVIIIGIFVLQFRTDSSIIKKIGGLQITLAQTENGTETVLKNSLRISYNGLNLYCDENNPLVLKNINNEKTNLVLTDWSSESPLSYKFAFTNDVNLLISLSSDDNNASFTLMSILPEDALELSIPYNFSSNTKVTSENSEHLIVSGKKDSWEILASKIENNRLAISNQLSAISYSVYTETKKFTFEALADLPIANELIFQKNIETFKTNLISAYKANSLESNISEQVAISYIATMAERGQYNDAVESIPQSLRKGKQRTFLSAPYFGSLEEMNVQLESSIKDYERRISDSSNTGNLDIFTVNNIASYICIHSSPSTARRLLQKAAAQSMEEASIAQVTGLMQVYVNLLELNPDYAELLKPAMDDCIERITSACAFENNVLTISENDTFLSVIQAVETGIAILRYGNVSDNTILQKAGYVMVNSYLTESASFDLRTLANLLPIIAYNNTYIPHFDIIRSPDLKPILAWTCAKDINYTKEIDGSLSLSIDFSEGDTHYMICRGLPQFTKIYIYDMLYRTDPRFETYNSSGYVYKNGTNTLLLKSRHKAKTEVIRFEFN